MMKDRAVARLLARASVQHHKGARIRVADYGCEPVGAQPLKFHEELRLAYCSVVIHNIDAPKQEELISSCSGSCRSVSPLGHGFRGAIQSAARRMAAVREAEAKR